MSDPTREGTRPAGNAAGVLPLREGALPVAAIAAFVAMIAVARLAAADPTGSRVLTAPTAWLPRAGEADAMLGIDHRSEGAAVVGYGLGGLAEIELGSETDIRAGTDETERPSPLVLGRAGFRLGARQDTGFTGMPAIVFGVRTTFAAHGHEIHQPRASDAYLVASRDLGVVRLHAGVDALSASASGRRSAAQLRPLAGVELHPPMYPRSTLFGDIAWQPRLDAQAGPQLEWLLGIGVRYQALSWAAVELAVRARQAEDLGASTVMIRLHTALAH
ncbi:MAG TPA: hypothetical protein VHN14_28720 [Kofleriaceae bacterium]|nr:hypothetical protein [Kofleriaceae bacterium]